MALFDTDFRLKNSITNQANKIDKLLKIAILAFISPVK